MTFVLCVDLGKEGKEKKMDDIYILVGNKMKLGENVAFRALCFPC